MGLIGSSRGLMARVLDLNPVKAISDIGGVRKTIWPLLVSFVPRRKVFRNNCLLTKQLHHGVLAELKWK